MGTRKVTPLTLSSSQKILPSLVVISNRSKRYKNQNIVLNGILLVWFLLQPVKSQPKNKTSLFWCFAKSKTIISIGTSFSSIEVEDLKTIAIALWHENYLPPISNLDSIQQKRAGYLIDRLMRYNCVSKSQKLELLTLVKTLQNDISSRINLSESDVEPLAMKWGLNEDISELMPDILEYQTRHYLAEVS